MAYKCSNILFKLQSCLRNVDANSDETGTIIIIDAVKHNKLEELMVNYI